MIRRIRWRIAIPYVVLILVTMLSLGYYLSVTLRQTQLIKLEEDLLHQAQLLGEALSRVDGIAENAELQNELALSWSGITGGRVTILAVDGSVIGESHGDREKMENHSDRPEVQQALREGRGTSMRFSETLSQEMLYVAVPAESGGEIVAVIRVALPIAQIEQTLDSLQRTIITVTLIAAIIATLLGMLIAGRITSPLADLTVAAGQLAGGELKSLPSPGSSDEVGRLVIAFNQMAVALHEQIDALDIERSKLAAVLQRMDDGVLIVDAEGLVQLLNPSAERMFQITEEEALNRSIVETLRHHELVELWRRTKETEVEQFNSLEIGLERRSLQVVATPLGQAMPGSIVLVLQDLTRLRRLETVRRDFISNISHELRTPLASLKALTETLREGAFDDPPAARRFLLQMETEVDALTQMVQELLELTRIESGKVPLQLQLTSPAELLDSAVVRLGLQAERAGLSIEVHVDPDLPQLLVDPPRIEQVLVNLLHNAIKFTHSGGLITLEAHSEDQDVLFLVRDTGVGIPSDDLPRIFERFYKADPARSGGGTGLGLAISRHLVEAHGGRIWAESELNQGSTFYLTLPRPG